MYHKPKFVSYDLYRGINVPKGKLAKSLRHWHH